MALKQEKADWVRLLCYLVVSAESESLWKQLPIDGRDAKQAAWVVPLRKELNKGFVLQEHLM